LSFGEGKINLAGKALYAAEALGLEVDINGQVTLPDDLCGHSVYITRVEPDGSGRTKSIGEGSLFRASGNELKVKIKSSQVLHPTPLPHPIRATEFRIATEDGELHGNSYRLTIHSIFDAHNSMSLVEKM